MKESEQTTQTTHTTSNAFFGESAEASPDSPRKEKKDIFRLAYASYARTRLLSWLLLGGFLLCAAISVVLGRTLWSTYAHVFVPYLRWQDVLVASLWYVTLITLSGCVLVVRFLHALYTGHHKGMVILSGDTELKELIVRDLSPKNLSGICGAVGTACACFVLGVVGLVPEMLLGWTLHLPYPALVVLGTAVVILLGVVGLVVTLLTAVAIGIGMVGCVSFGKRMGAPQSYPLTSQATVRIDSLVLMATYPDRPESMVDLRSLEAGDQRRLLSLLGRYRRPEVGEGIEETMQEAEEYTVLA